MSPDAAQTVRIDPAAPDETETVRQLFREYADWLEVDLCFQGFEEELAGLPGAYVPPAGGLWLARVEGKLAGVVALRPHDAGRCELKRLWVRPGFRGYGLGRRLVEVAIAAGRKAGHGRLCLDTLGQMTTARPLYESLGFGEIEAYYDNPLEDVRYMELAL